MTDQAGLPVSREVMVGGRPRTLARFRSYKLTLALDVLSGVTDQLRDLFVAVATEREKYAKENPERITRQMCIDRASDLKRAAQVTSDRADAVEKEDRSADEDEEKVKERDTDVRNLRAQAAHLNDRAATWERQLEDMGDKPFIEYPGKISDEEAALIGIPYAMKMRRQFVQLIGLALVPDEMLEQAWITDTVMDVLQEEGQKVLFLMEAGEEIELIVACKEMLQAQLRPRRGALAELRELRSGWAALIETPALESGQNGAPQEPDSEPTSSTSSPEEQDGQPETSSSDSPTTKTSS